MTSLRQWATPLTIGMFVLMAVTGLLLFFESASGLNKTVHEWGGLVLVTAVGTHIFVNWLPFKRYLGTSNLARGIVGVCVLVLAGSFLSLPGAPQGARPSARVVSAAVNAPLVNVAALQGETPEQVVAALAAAGIEVSDPQQSIAMVTKGDRELQDKAVGALFPQKSLAPTP